MTGRHEGGATDSASVIDARGLRCPWPVLRAARAMRLCSRFILVADDAQAWTDVPLVAARHGWACEARREDADLYFTLATPSAGAAD